MGKDEFDVHKRSERPDVELFSQYVRFSGCKRIGVGVSVEG